MDKPAQVLLTTWLDHPGTAFVEWVAHHRALGADRIVVFLSDALEAPQPLAAALERAGMIETRFIAFDSAEAGETIRNAAIRAAELEAGESGGWGVFLAADEYLVLPRHDTLPALMQQLGTVHALSAPVRRFFAETLTRAHVPGPVLSRAGNRAPDPAPDGTGCREWRSVVRLGLWPSRVPGFPTGEARTGLRRLRWLNGSGARMPTPRGDRTWQRDARAFGGDLAQVARVPVPSVETLLLRAAYVHPPKAQAMAEDLIPLLEAARGPRVADDSLAKGADAREAEIGRILADPSVRQAYDAQCAEEAERIGVQSRKHGLWRAVLAWLDGDAAAGPGPAAAAPAPDPDPAPPVRAAPARPAPAADSAAPVKEHSRVPDAFARVATDPPPPWFAEIYPGGNRQGFFTRLENHAIVHIERDPDTLIVTFDNLSNVHDISYGREPWAYRFVRGAGYSHLAVIARRKDWYRDAQFIEELRGLADRGLFSRYKKVVMAGTSMGGFAALAFSSLAPGCIVLAYSPQTTLDQDLVPWEERFDMGRERNWSLPYSDASFEIQEARKVYVVYDPFFEPDRRHVERLEGDNVVPLKSWFAGHFSAVFVRRAELIKPLFQMAIDETLTEPAYYRLLRGRRSLQWYRQALEKRANATGHPGLASRVGPAFKRLRRQRQARQAPQEA
ncbi:glycosyltransferase family 2 protein [Roseovarius salis]|uniref:glycosyltransferase family 2 protein n=1 Tax=Roseovarius salis TaxID=3376063 RepID=UPI0037CA05C3